MQQLRLSIYGFSLNTANLQAKGKGNTTKAKELQEYCREKRY